MKGQEGPRICQAAYFPHPHTDVVCVGVRSRQTQKDRCVPKGVVPLELPTVSRSPAGSDPKLSSTVRGSSRTLVVSVKPPESVAVSLSSR